MASDAPVSGAHADIRWVVDFDAKRDPMFQDDRGGGWVPIATFDEQMASLVQRLETTEKALREIKGYNSHNNESGCRCGHRMSMCNAVMAATYCSGHPAAGIAAHALGECPPVCWLCIRDEREQAALSGGGNTSQ